MATEQQWTPPRVRNIDRELAHCEQELPYLERAVVECKERIDRLKARQEQMSGR